jgi:transcription elongation factor GreA
MDQDDIILTRAGYEKLKRELEMLLTEDREEVVAQLLDVRDDTEAGEEATFYDAIRSKELVDQRIAHLQGILVRATIIDDDPDPERVSPGNRVTAVDMETKESIFFDLIGSEEVAHGRSGVSIESPVGKALLNHSIGDTVEVEVPIGTVRYKIKKIEMIPDD